MKNQFAISTPAKLYRDGDRKDQKPNTSDLNIWAFSQRLYK